jgi:hypothetical protein
VALGDFLAEPFVHVIPVSDTVARHHDRVFAGLRRAGTGKRGLTTSAPRAARAQFFFFSAAVQFMATVKPGVGSSVPN